MRLAVVSGVANFLGRTCISPEMSPIWGVYISVGRVQAIAEPLRGLYQFPKVRLQNQYLQSPSPKLGRGVWGEGKRSAITENWY